MLRLEKKLKKYSSKFLRALTIARYHFKNWRSNTPVTCKGGPVVSLTSYSTRVDAVFLTLESIAAGELKPSRLILWLDEAERLANLPDSLKRLQLRGLEILACANYGPHKKYYPFVATQVLDVPLVTADDDVLYPAYWLQGLVAAAQKAPGTIICYKARKIDLTADGFGRYTAWSIWLGFEAQFWVFAIGVSGVLYPLSFLQVLKEQSDSFMESCPKADDIWLHLNALRHDYRVKQISVRDEHFPSLPGTQDIALFKSNIKQGENDRVIKLLYTANDIDKIRHALKCSQ